MERNAFMRLIADEGFAEVVTVTRNGGEVLDTHSHPFEAKALILDGELHLRVGDTVRVYRPGDIFHLQPNEPHSETFGPQGVQYLVGRK